MQLLTAVEQGAQAYGPLALIDSAWEVWSDPSVRAAAKC